MCQNAEIKMNENHRVNIFAKKVPSTLLDDKVHQTLGWLQSIKIFFMTCKDRETTGDDNRMVGGIPWFKNLKWQI